MFYTGKEIAEMYSTKTIQLKEKNIRNWANRGLKHLRGPHNTFIYKIEWVNEYLEEQARLNAEQIKVNSFEIKNKTNLKRKTQRYDFSECKVV